MKFLKIVVPTIFLIFLIFLGIKRTDGFRTEIITRFKDFDDKREIKLVDKSQVNDILSQKFKYLTKGRECFIFESEDKNYVLKFFDSTRYNTIFLFPKIPFPKSLNAYMNKHFNRRTNRLNFNVTSAKLAMGRLKDQAALIYVNTNKKDGFNKVLISNKYGKNYLIDVTDVFFILQKKCDIFYQTYGNSKDDNYKIELISKFLQMVHQRTLQLIIDDDIGKKRKNWGICAGEVVTFDIGRWYSDDKLSSFDGYKKEMLKGTKILRKYLKENDLDKLKIVESKLNEYFVNFKQKNSF